MISCKSSSNVNIIEHSYTDEIKNFNCAKLSDELLFLDINIANLEEQSQNAFFDNFMESLVSIGIYSGNSAYKMNKNKKKFTEKKNLVMEYKSYKNC